MHTAIFGGTFDPVHEGHAAMVRSAIAEFGLKKLVIVPNGNPPHKAEHSITDFCHRYNMLALAFGDISEVELSDYEAREDKFSYSLDTMRYFRRVYGEDTSFIIGADSLLSIHTWYSYETLLKENHFIVFRREGDKDLGSIIKRYGSAFDASIDVSSMECVDISSTYIRSALRNGSLPRGILADNVHEYIVREGLYGD